MNIFVQYYLFYRLFFKFQVKMRSFLFIVLASYAVRCDDNYYVIEMPKDVQQSDSQRPFKVYWNVPTMQCTSKKIPFTNLYRFGIIQNTGDSFRGDKIAILYDPGLFPALLKNETSGKYKFRNGGVPQEGDLEKHIAAFTDILKTSVPDPDFNGVGIIDFESWRPVFRQNFGVLVPYKDVSLEIERKLHWWWPKAWMQAEAKRRFEEAARTFMVKTLTIAKQMRPKATWGYYGFPYCFNMANKDMVEACSDTTLLALVRKHISVPSVYSSKELTTSQLGSLIRGRVDEAVRVRRKGSPVLPYFWFRYREGGYLTEDDLDMALKTFYKSGADGFIIWGSSKDVNTAEKCTELRDYIEHIMGPAIAKYATNMRRTENDVFSEHNNSNKINENKDNAKNETGVEPDPEYHWVPPENYTQNIEQHVKELIKNTRFNISNDNEATESPERNILLDLVLHLIMNEQQNITEILESTSEYSTTKNSKRDVTANNLASTDNSYSMSISTTDKDITSTTEDSSTIQEFTEYTTTEDNPSVGTTTEESDMTSVEYTTVESSTQTIITTKITTEGIVTTVVTSTTDDTVSENNKSTNTAILDVNMTEFLLNDISKSEKKGFPLVDNPNRRTEAPTDDAKNNKKGLPKNTNLEESTTKVAPYVHQVDF